jgi:polar amino acid transport system substrate-binding protein
VRAARYIRAPQALTKEDVVRRIVFVLAAAAFAVTAVAASAGSTALPTKQPGKLIVGFDLPAPAFWNGQASGNTIVHPTGFEHSLAVDIAHLLKISNIQFLRAPFATILLAGKKPYDFALEETTITPARAKAVSFSASYFPANQGVLISKGTPKPKRIADLKSLQTCAQATTTGLAWIQHKLRPAKKPLVYSASSTAAFDAVQAGSCQALILDAPIVVSQSKKKPGAYGGVVAQIDTHEAYGAVMEKNSPLKPFVSRAINTLRKNGTIDKLIFRWFGYYPYKIPTLK